MLENFELKFIDEDLVPLVVLLCQLYCLIIDLQKEVRVLVALAGKAHLVAHSKVEVSYQEGLYLLLEDQVGLSVEYGSVILLHDVSEHSCLQNLYALMGKLNGSFGVLLLQLDDSLIVVTDSERD